MNTGRTLVLLAVLALAPGCKRGAPAPAPTGSASASASAGLPDAPPAPRRCEDPAGDAWLTLGDEKGASDDDPMPYAVEVGNGVAHDAGFALGALVPQGRGAAAVVVTVGADGRGMKSVSLGLAHGDTPPPRVAHDGSGVVAALLEAGASGRRLRLARVEGDAVAWGPSFEQGRDESLAYDLALAEPRGIVVWDDDAKDPDRGTIRVATFVSKGLSAPTRARIVTGKQTDAEMPRVVVKPGGFWLTWIARKPEATDDEAREPGEEAEYRWLEAMPLDGNGSPTAPARRLTPATGHVLTYDLMPTASGGALIVYRDDDTPSGSGGGVVLRVVLRADGSGEPSVVADQRLGIGAPTLLPGFLAIADSSAETRLAVVTPEGDLADALVPEPVLGRGEPIAARNDVLLISRPRGTAVRLATSRCQRAVIAPPAPSGPVPPVVP